MKTTDDAAAALGIAGAACPTPHVEAERVLLGHGSGGLLSSELLRDVIIPALGPAAPGGALEDGAVVHVTSQDLVLSTDSFVVSPLFFAGGDIGTLAVHGTVNDLAMMGSLPVALTVAFVIEEGFPMADLRRVCASIGAAASAVGAPVVTGDTKVVGKGAADGLFVTTTGLGRRLPQLNPSAERAEVGDVVIVSAPIGSHGTTILSTRAGLAFEADIASDTRPLHWLVATMATVAGDEIHVLRDPTRGGVASTLNEIAQSSKVRIRLEESAIPVPPAVSAVCEMLGLDPLHVANEGCLLAVVTRDAADRVLAVMRTLREGHEARVIGEVIEGAGPRVVMRTRIGSTRIVDMLVGEQLPRIC
ncbi:MAG TPA: hydrogenase expression/formation protein HypE [Acidothermaceae bacterium]